MWHDYVLVDNRDRIIAITSNFCRNNLNGWLRVDSGDDERHMRPDALYFPGGLAHPDQTHRYIYDPNLSPAYREATAEELALEREEIEAARVPVGPTAEQITQQMITDLELQGFEQGQAITDLELQALEQGQALTDYDLKTVESNQKITDMELSDIENGQKATDLEIKVLELMESVRRYQGTI